MLFLEDLVEFLSPQINCVSKPKIRKLVYLQTVRKFADLRIAELTCGPPFDPYRDIVSLLSTQKCQCLS
jgi:hypothetical protein